VQQRGFALRKSRLLRLSGLHGSARRTKDFLRHRKQENYVLQLMPLPLVLRQTATD
jgi:hypothetical protein